MSNSEEALHVARLLEMTIASPLPSPPFPPAGPPQLLQLPEPDSFAVVIQSYLGSPLCFLDPLPAQVARPALFARVWGLGSFTSARVVRASVQACGAHGCVQKATNLPWLRGLVQSRNPRVSRGALEEPLPQGQLGAVKGVARGVSLLYSEILVIAGSSNQIITPN